MSEQDEINAENTLDASMYIQQLERQLAEAQLALQESVRLLKQGKAQFAPNTTNSDVDVFLARQALKGAK